jgi:hypothetical protein
VRVVSFLTDAVVDFGLLGYVMHCCLNDNAGFVFESLSRFSISWNGQRVESLIVGSSDFLLRADEVQCNRSGDFRLLGTIIEVGSTTGTKDLTTFGVKDRETTVAEKVVRFLPVVLVFQPDGGDTALVRWFDDSVQAIFYVA